MSSPRLLVTCGPAHEPIDEVRRITNQSSGELGATLANTLAEAGFDVTCYRGEGATCPAPRVPTHGFGTNASLEQLLQNEAGKFDAVFHAAALCDFRVENSQHGKIRSDSHGLTISLVPAHKIIRRLRTLFPQALIVGWKYELEGPRENALERGRAQMATCHTDACVVNGRAYGEGFGVLEANSPEVLHLPDKLSLSQHLTGWIKVFRGW
ncbi:MAG: phosphopantothenoylcysteine decarboxylase [Terrimicrobiaceae bacterium]